MKRHTKKKNKIGATKIGTIFLVSIMALAAVGVGYSMWSEEITIIGTVGTGELKVGIYDYMTLDEGPNFLETDGELFPIDTPNDGTIDPNQEPGDNSEGKNVASHNSLNNGEFVCTKTVDGSSYDFVDKVTEVVDNAYPWYKSGTELWIGNGGTIPVKISDITFQVTDGNPQLMDFIVFDSWELKLWDVDSWLIIDSGNGLDALEQALLCYQIDPCQTLSAYIEFYFLEEIPSQPGAGDGDSDGDGDPGMMILPQNNNVKFEITVTAAQWNEVSCGGCTPSLVINKEVTDDRPEIGDDITYTITVTNNGGCDATNVEVTDEEPEGLEFNSASSDIGVTSLNGDGDLTWNIAILGPGVTATITIEATVVGAGSATSEQTQLALLIDGSESITPTDWGIMLDGIALAITDGYIPHDGNVELTVIQFGGWVNERSWAQVELGGPIVLDAGNYGTVATSIQGISQLLGGTAMSCAFRLAADVLSGDPNSKLAGTAFAGMASTNSDWERQVVNLITDGQPNIIYDDTDRYYGTWADDGGANEFVLGKQDTEAALAYYESLIPTTGDDEIDAEAVGTATDIPWLRDNVVRPGSYDTWPPAGPGWVRHVADYTDLADTLKEKFELIFLEINNCAIVSSDQTGQQQACITINPQPQSEPA